MTEEQGLIQLIREKQEHLHDVDERIAEFEERFLTEYEEELMVHRAAHLVPEIMQDYLGSDTDDMLYFGVTRNLLQGKTLSNSFELADQGYATIMQVRDKLTEVIEYASIEALNLKDGHLA